MTPSTRHSDLSQYTGMVMAVMLLSRIFGFLREWTVAHQLGSSAVTDTYYAAFTLPDLLSYLVAGGTIGMFFIPVFFTISFFSHGTARARIWLRRNLVSQ